jgi:hypothetical protein
VQPSPQIWCATHWIQPLVTTQPAGCDVIDRVPSQPITNPDNHHVYMCAGSTRFEKNSDLGLSFQRIMQRTWIDWNWRQKVMTPLIHSITQHNHNYTSQSPMTCKANIGMMADQGSSPGNRATVDYVSCRTQRKRLDDSFSFYQGLILHRYRWSSTNAMAEKQCP